MSEWVRISRAEDVPEQGFRTGFVSGMPIAVRRVGAEFFAIQNVCPHRGGPLGEGDAEGFALTCPLHGWTFDLRSGQHTLNPVVRVKTYPVRVSDGWVEVASGAAPPPEPPPAPDAAQARKPFWRFGR